MRNCSLLIILVMLGACNFGWSQSDATSSSTIEFEQPLAVTPDVQFVQATLTPAPTAEALAEQQPIATHRAFEN